MIKCQQVEEAAILTAKKQQSLSPEFCHDLSNVSHFHGECFSLTCSKPRTFPIMFLQYKSELKIESLIKKKKNVVHLFRQVYNPTMF